MARKERTPRTKIHEVTAANDIKYRGPLTFQHLQMMGWLCIVASQAALILNIGSRVDASVLELYQSFGGVLDALSGLSLPLLLIANFAQILDSSDGYKKQLIKNAGASLGVFLFSVFFFNRYIVNALAAMSTNPADAKPALEAMVHVAAPAGFVSFNLFIDLLLCTLVMLFLNYQPKRFFQGKLIYVFRLFTLLPIAYEIVCMVLKVLSAKKSIVLPLWVFPLLPMKPPMTFFLFILLAVFVKLRELRFRRHGKTHAEYQEFLKTNKNSWNLSVFLAIMMVVVSILDFAVMTGYSLIGTAQILIKNEEEMAAYASPSPVLEGELPLGESTSVAQEEPNAGILSETAAPDLAASPDSGSLLAVEPVPPQEGLFTEDMTKPAELDFANMTDEEILTRMVGLMGEKRTDAMPETAIPVPAASPDPEPSPTEDSVALQEGLFATDTPEPAELNFANMTDEEILMLLMGLMGEDAIDPELLLAAEGPTPQPMSEEERRQMLVTAAMESEMSTANALGFGGSVNLIILAPLMLLFSYTKTPRSSKVGIIIPVGGIVLIFFLYLEAIRLAFWGLPIPKVDLSQITQLAKLMSLSPQ